MVLICAISLENDRDGKAFLLVQPGELTLPGSQNFFHINGLLKRKRIINRNDQGARENNGRKGQASLSGQRSAPFFQPGFIR